MRTKKVIRAPHTIKSIMKRKQRSKLIRYTRKDWLMSDQGLAGINLWIIEDMSGKFHYYDDTWTSRFTIYFTDKPISVNEAEAGHFIFVWKWRRDLMAVALSTKTFAKAARFRQKAIASCYRLGRHAEYFRDGADDEPDFVNTLSAAVDRIFY